LVDDNGHEKHRSYRQQDESKPLVACANFRGRALLL